MGQRGSGELAGGVGGGGGTRVCRICLLAKDDRAFGLKNGRPHRTVCGACRGRLNRSQKATQQATSGRVCDPNKTPPDLDRRDHAPPPDVVLPADNTPINIAFPTDKPIVRVGFIPDCHHPNAHTKSWSLMLRAMHRWQPEVLVVLGDFADAETLSAHPPDEPGSRDFADEVESVKKALDQLEELHAVSQVYIAGNHEFRLERYLARQAPALFRQLKGWPTLLDLHERGWQWVPYRRSASLGKLHITHDTGSAGMNAHRMSSAVFGGSALIGHTHRMAYEVRGRYDSTPYLAAMLGWLGDAAEAGKYMHEAKSAEWVHGFGVGLLETGTGIVHLQPVPIVHGRCVVGGELVT